MIRWYADNSELNSIYYSQIPDILLFGGIVIREEDEQELRSKLNKLKSKISPDFHFPIKWNFKDLKTHFDTNNQKQLYSEINARSKEIREDIFTLTSSSEVKIITCCLLSHAVKRESMKLIKDKLAGCVFANGLQRFGIYISTLRTNANIEVLLDWPDKSQPKPYNDEYESAYHHGRTVYKQSYKCGKLSDLGFYEGLRFSKMTSCPFLQISDLIVGATRNLVDVAMGKNNDTFGFDMLKIVKDNFYGAPDNIVGRGICVSPTDHEISDKIKEIVNRLFEMVELPF